MASSPAHNQNTLYLRIYVVIKICRNHISADKAIVLTLFVNIPEIFVIVLNSNLNSFIHFNRNYDCYSSKCEMTNRSNEKEQQTTFI